MAQLSLHDIERLAMLTRLEVQPAQAQEALTHINQFFGLVEKMSATDTTGIEPLHHPVSMIQDISLRLRPDMVSETNQREANQAAAPAVEAGLFLVPRVIE